LIDNAADPFVGFAIFFLIGEQIADARNFRGFEFFVDISDAPDNDCARAFRECRETKLCRTLQNVNKAVFDDISQQAAHSRRNQIARTAHINRRIVVEHIEPDAMRFGKLFRAEARAFHFFQQALQPNGRGQPESVGSERLKILKPLIFFELP
jgi:hypothetical protein